MKKTIIIIVSIISALAIGVTLTCALIHPMDSFKIKMATAKSYQVDATVYDIPIIGTQTATLKVDGDVTYTSGALLGGEKYTKKLNDTEYVYTKNESGEWTKKVSDGSGSGLIKEDTIDYDTILEMFDPDNYDKVDGEKNKYAQKPDVVISEDFKNVVITIDDDYCIVETVYPVNIFGVELSVKMQAKIYNFGDVKLTLPETE